MSLRPMFRTPFRHVASDVLHDLPPSWSRWPRLLPQACSTAYGMRSDGAPQELDVFRDHSGSPHARGPRRAAWRVPSSAGPADGPARPWTQTGAVIAVIAA